MTKSNEEIIQELKTSKLVKEKDLGNGLFSYNFTRKAFYDKHWDDVTTRARGLFIRDSKVVCRSYDKFFNVNEQVSKDALKDKFVYPVQVYKKENGYLGLLSYDSVNDNLLFCSKSTNNGDFAGWFKDHFTKTFRSSLNDIKSYLKSTNTTMVFEVCLPELDPHIIEHSCDHIRLLDVVNNDFNFRKQDYCILTSTARRFGFKHKCQLATINNYEEFLSAFDAGKEVVYEGVVYEDASGFMIKQKSDFYNKWKQLRTIVERIKKDQYVKTVGLDSESLDFISWYQYMIDNYPEFKEFGIIELRKRFNDRSV